MMHQWVRFSLECFSSMFYFDINFIWRLWCYLKCWLDDQKKKRNQFLTFIFVKCMLNVWSEKNNQHRTWINQLTNHWKMLVYFSLWPACRSPNVRRIWRFAPDKNNSFEKLFMLATGLDRWNSFVTTFHSIVFFILVFKWPHRSCAVLLCIVYSKFTVCTCTTGLYAHKPYACVFRNFFVVV